jgi:transcriptional regulator with XRE-family HTH domain
MKQARLAAGMTQLALAERTGVKIGMIEAIEGGRTPGKLIVLHKISDVLQTPLRLMFPSAFEESVAAYRLAVGDSEAPKKQTGGRQD